MCAFCANENTKLNGKQINEVEGDSLLSHKNMTFVTHLATRSWRSYLIMWELPPLKIRIIYFKALFWRDSMKTVNVKWLV